MLLEVEAVPEVLERGLEQRVLAFWSHVLGVEAGRLDRDGFVAVADRRDFATQRRATIRTARGTLLLAAPAEERAAVAEPETYSADVATRAHGIGLLHYLARAPAGERDPRVCVLRPADRPLLDELQDAAGAAATEEAEVDVDDPLAVGITEDGGLLAIASLLDEGSDTVDIGVLVDPAQRRRGLGAAVVREIAERATRAEQLVQYRCNRENEASARLARACGFTIWGVLSVASLPDWAHAADRPAPDGI
jgi:GNAT superfamily N-acetyltransferase